MAEGNVKTITPSLQMKTFACHKAKLLLLLGSPLTLLHVRLVFPLTLQFPICDTI